MSVGPVGCGVLEHADTCLCDVVIARPLPPLTECMRNFTEDVGMASEVAKFRGHSVPWTNDTILDYLLDVQKFWDAWNNVVTESGDIDYDCLQDVPPVVVDCALSDTANWAKIRSSVLYCMERFDEPFVDILRHLKVSPQLFAMSVSHGKSKRTWDWDDVGAFDAAFMRTTLEITDMARTFGLTPDEVDGFRKYWTVRRQRVIGSNNPVRDYFMELCSNPDLSNGDVVVLVHEKYGKLYTKSAVSQARRRNRNRTQP